MPKNQVVLDQHGIIVINVVGDQTSDTVRQMGTQIAKLIDSRRKQNSPVLILDDLSQMGQTDTAARKQVAELARRLNFDRAAMLGNGSPMMRYGTTFMIRAFGQVDKVRYFDDRAKALEWLSFLTA